MSVNKNHNKKNSSNISKVSSVKSSKPTKSVILNDGSICLTKAKQDNADRSSYNLKSKVVRGRKENESKSRSLDQTRRTTSNDKMAISKVSRRMRDRNTEEQNKIAEPKSSMSKVGSTMKTVKSNRLEPKTGSSMKNGKKDEDVGVRLRKNNSSKKGKSDKGSGRTSKAIGKLGRTVKKFVSRPVTEDKVKNFMNNVKAKSTTPATTRQVRMGEDVFVSKKNRQHLAEVLQTDTPANEDYSGTVTEDGDEKTWLLPKNTNFNNGGAIMEKGRPFWQIPSICPTDEDLKGFEETKEMNAQSIVDVSEGTLKLKSMPTIPIAIDPYGELQILKTRDASFFNLDVIFGNTIRSMINTTNESQSQGMEKSQLVTKIVEIVEPKNVRVYDRKTRESKGERKFVSMLKRDEEAN